MTKSTILALLLSAAACATVIACTTADPASKDKAATNGKTSTTGDGGTTSGGDGTGAPAGGSGVTIVRTGMVTMSQTIVEIPGQDDMAVVSAFAMFTEAATATATTTQGGVKCSTSTEGDCSITECDASGATASDGGVAVGDAGAPKKAPNAGDISLTGVREAKLAVGANGSYSPLSDTNNGPLWDDEGGVTVKAAGADVPAFEKNLKGASSITITAPEFPDTPGAPLAIDRSGDLVLTWDGGTAGEVLVSATSVADKKNAMMSCKFKADAGTGTITTAALGKMLAGSGTFGIASTNSEIVSAGDWKVTLSVTGAVKAATGTMGALATFQ